MSQSVIYAAASVPAEPIVSVPLADVCGVGPGREHPVAAVLALAAAAVVAGMRGTPRSRAGSLMYRRRSWPMCTCAAAPLPRRRRRRPRSGGYLVGCDVASLVKPPKGSGPGGGRGR